MNLADSSAHEAFALLRKLARPRRQTERCELCSTDLLSEHAHLVERVSRKLVCCCDACAVLFSGTQHARYRRVPRRVAYLADFHMTDAEWESLHIPISLAFFVNSSASGRVVAAYPGPAGTTESLLTLDAWQRLEEQNPTLRELEPDVEALLVNRVCEARDYYRAPIDECFKLAGLIRTYWRGFAGGTEVWGEIKRFFAELKERAN